MEILQIDPKKIQANPYQPRIHFNQQELEDLVSSIRTHGILQPLLVTRAGDNFELIAGERRLRAAQILKLPSIPAVVQDRRLKNEKLELAIIENIQRADLNPIERAQAFKRLGEEFDLTQEEVAKRLGKPRTSIANTLRLLALPPEIQKAITDGKISEGHGKILASIQDPRRQKELAEQIVGRSLSVRSLETLVQKARKQIQKPEDFALSEKEEMLTSHLSTKVRIEKGKAGSGRIVIEYWSNEELNGIVSKILED